MNLHDLSEIMDEHYLLKRLVYVNSAKHAYSEIMLDAHMALFGKNNVGKTASLAGIKLTLFPEVSFTRNDEKFRFRGKAGLYPAIDSYKFYFPRSDSFIVLEVENPEGPFCMVLYRMAEMGYGRFFIPVEYDKLRPVFWDSDKQGFSEQFGMKSLKAFVQSNKGVQVADPKQLRKMMFSRTTLGRNVNRYATIPIIDDRAESIEAFYNIYHLAFDNSDIETQSLPSAIATLLEMRRGHERERLDANLLKLADEYDALITQGNYLKKVSNAKSAFDRVEQLYQTSSDLLLHYSSLYRSLESALNTAKETHSSRLLSIKAPYDDAVNTAKATRITLNELSTQKSQLEGVISNIEKDLKQLDKKIGDAKQILGSYPGMNKNEILDIHHEQEEETLAKIQANSDQETMRNSYSNNLKESNRCVQRIAKLEELISNTNQGLLTQLSEHAANVLNSINSNFADIGLPLEEKQIIAVESFAQLFHQQDAHLFLQTDLVPNTHFNIFLAGANKVKWQDELHTLKNKKEDLQAEMRDQDLKLKEWDNNSQQRQDNTKELEQELVEIQQATANIEGLTTNQRSRVEKNIQFEALQTEFESHNHELTAVIRQHEESSAIVADLSRQMDEIKQENSTIESSEQMLNLVKSNTQPAAAHDVIISHISLNKDNNDALLNQSKQVNKELDLLSKAYDGLENLLPHSDIEPHKVRSDLADYRSAIDSYSSSFQTLDYDNIQYQQAVSNHNQLVSNQLNELQDAKNLLDTYIREINAELNGKYISNLSEIHLDLEINPAFQDLLNTLNKQDIKDDTLLEPAFYETLASFVDKYFNKKTRRLKMADIISKVSYRYRLRETGEYVKKSQSGGTTSAITAILISVLLKRVTAAHVYLKMPIVVDEIGSLDSSNTASTIKQIADHGFSIFCATPTFSAHISQKVGRWLMVNNTTIAEPKVEGCHTVILPEHVEDYGKIA